MVGDFALKAQAVIVTSGGIGANHDLVRQSWPKRLGEPPKHMLSGVPDHVDGRMLEIVERAGGNIINRDRMWHYTEGITNFAPIWTRARHPHPAGSVVAVDRRDAASACRCRCSRASIRSARSRTCSTTGHDYSWFVLTQKIIEREFALSGSEQNPDLTGKSMLQGARPPLRRARRRCDAFKKQGVDFIVKQTLPRAGRGA